MSLFCFCVPLRLSVNAAAAVSTMHWVHLQRWPTERTCVSAPPTGPIHFLSCGWRLCGLPGVLLVPPGPFPYVSQSTDQTVGRSFRYKRIRANLKLMVINRIWQWYYFYLHNEMTRKAWMLFCSTSHELRGLISGVRGSPTCHLQFLAAFGVDNVTVYIRSSRQEDTEREKNIFAG